MYSDRNGIKGIGTREINNMKQKVSDSYFRQTKIICLHIL